MTRAATSWLVLAALVAVPGVGASGADFTAVSSSTHNTLVADPYFTPAAVGIDSAGPVRAAAPVEASATSERGIDRVRIEVSPAGAGSWTEVCVDDAAPYACDWDTTGTPNGSMRDFRAVALDRAGYERTSPVVARMVDNAVPTVALNPPGPWLEGTEVLTTVGGDAHSGLATLAIEYRPVGGGAWTEVCSGPVNPRSCPLQTTTLADGAYELRGRAVDAAGNVQTSMPHTRTVDNDAPSVAMTDPGAMRSTVTLAATTGDGAGTGVVSVRYEYRQGPGAWTEICTGAVQPFSCPWVTIAWPDGLYDLRAVATDGAGHATTSPAITARIDNTVPAVPTLADPGSPVAGALAFTGTASDTGSGIATWEVQYRTAGGVAWTNACTDTAPAYGCSWASTSVADGLYDFRAVARDAAGNEAVSALRTNRRVDNTGPTVTLTDPGPVIRATWTLTATASDPSGVQSVVFERRPAAGGTWTVICTDATPAYSCALDTTVLADGDYELRARAADALGNESAATRTTRVDNTPPVPVDVQAGNGGATPGRLEAGDWVALTWSEAIAPASVLAGWTGTPIAIRVVLENGGGGKDEMDFYDSTGATRLNLVATNADLKLAADYASTAAQFDGTMTISGPSITITLGVEQSGTMVTAPASRIQWRPSSLATDIAGNPSVGGQVSETGAVDVDF